MPNSNEEQQITTPEESALFSLNDASQPVVDASLLSDEEILARINYISTGQETAAAADVADAAVSDDFNILTILAFSLSSW